MIAVEVHAETTIGFAAQPPLATFEAIAEAGLLALAVDLPFQIGAIGEQGFPQLTAGRRGVDGRLVDPDAAGVFRFAGAAAEQGRANQQAEEVAHGEIPKRGWCRAGPAAPPET